MPDSLDRRPSSPRPRRATAPAASRRTSACRGSAAAITSSRWVCVGRDDDDRVDRRVVDQRQRIGVATAARRTPRRPPSPAIASRIGHRHQPRFRNAAGQIARVDAAQAAERQSIRRQSRHPSSSFHVVLGHHLELDHDVGRQRLAADHLDRAFHRRPGPSRTGNCATDASIVPAAIAFFASSSASKPITRILPVLPAAAIASIAPSAIRSLHGEHGVDVGMRLQHVLEHVEALVALPVGRLRRDDRDARRVP